MEQIAHAIVAQVATTELLGADAKAIAQTSQDCWPADRLIECSLCNVACYPGGNWKCGNCGNGIWWGFEKKICQCGAAVCGHRRGWRIHWAPCPGCDEAEAARQEAVESFHQRRDKKQRNLELKLQVMREAAAECHAGRPGCKVRKLTDPEKPFCKACKGGVNS